MRRQSVGMENGAYTSSLAVLLRGLTRALLVEASLAQCITAIATMVAKIAVAGAARR